MRLSPLRVSLFGYFDGFKTDSRENFHISNIKNSERSISAVDVPYGYYLTPNGHVAIEQEKANIVRMIYQQ